MMKSIWQGTLKYGFAISVELYSTKHSNFHCKILHDKCFFEIENQYCNICKKLVTPNNITKELRFNKKIIHLKNELSDTFLIDNQMEILELIDINQFNDFSVLDFYYFVPSIIDTNYFLFTKLLSTKGALAKINLKNEEESSDNYCIIKKQKEHFLLATLDEEFEKEMQSKAIAKELVLSKLGI